MNIENIKASGLRLGLEAELNVQYRAIDGNVKEARANPKSFKNALQSAKNCVELLEELVKISSI